LSTFEVIQKYLEITTKIVLDDLFDTALEQLKSQKRWTFMYDTLFNIVEAMAVYQTKEKILKLYTDYIVGTLKNEGKNENTKFMMRRKSKKAYL
jgi:small basic protein